MQFKHVTMVCGLRVDNLRSHVPSNRSSHARVNLFPQSLQIAKKERRDEYISLFMDLKEMKVISNIFLVYSSNISTNQTE